MSAKIFKYTLLLLSGFSFWLYVNSSESVLVDFPRYLLIVFCGAMWVVVNKFLMQVSYSLQKSTLWMAPIFLGVFSDIAAAGMIIYWILGGCVTISSKGMYLTLTIFCGLSILLCEQENVKEEEYEKN